MTPQVISHDSLLQARGRRFILNRSGRFIHLNDAPEPIATLRALVKMSPNIPGVLLQQCAIRKSIKQHFRRLTIHRVIDPPWPNSKSPATDVWREVDGS